MQIIKLKIIDDKYTIITDIRPSTTTFDIRFRVMMINKIKTKEAPDERGFFDFYV